MISVGIDVSKGKSTVCLLKPYGEIVCKPFEVQHTETDLEKLNDLLQKLEGEIRIVMEATGIYHLPILTFLLKKGYFISVINPFLKKKFSRDNNLRGAKNDRLDSVMIASYGIEKWYKLKKYEVTDTVYNELRLLGRQYHRLMKTHVQAVQELTHLLDYTAPGLKGMFNSWTEYSNKDKLCDFVERFWHFDLITSLSREEFVEQYLLWAKKKKYHQSRSKAEKVYDLASNGIPTLPSSTPSTQIMIQEAIHVLRVINNSLHVILSRMKELAKTLPEYSTVRSMGGVGECLAPRLIAEIGDVRRLHSGHALIALAGIDPPPYASGQFVDTHRKISKRGSAILRKIGYEVMRMLKSHKEPEDNAVYNYILKKEAEGKNKKLAKIAGLNKFLRIYYTRVMEVYQ